MNQVFQSLRGEFELEDSYSGRAMLGTIMNTIKVQTAGDCCSEVGLLWLKGLRSDPKFKRYSRLCLKSQAKWHDFDLESQGQRPVRGRSRHPTCTSRCAVGERRSGSACCPPASEPFLLLGF